MDEIEATTKALHAALTKYASLAPHGTARVVVALFGLTHAKRLAPMLDEIAHAVQTPTISPHYLRIFTNGGWGAPTKPTKAPFDGFVGSGWAASRDISIARNRSNALMLVPLGSRRSVSLVGRRCVAPRARVGNQSRRACVLPGRPAPALPVGSIP